MKRRVVVTATEDAERSAMYRREFESKLTSDHIERVADELAELLENASKLENLNDYLDEYDLDHIGSAVDALYDFAEARAHE